MSINTRNDLKLLKLSREKFNIEKNNYITKSYNVFLNGYFSNCSDYHIQTMKSNLNNLYQDIFDSYKKISAWWDNYNFDLEKIEANLSFDKAIANGINESSVALCIDKLPELKKYKNPFSSDYFMSQLFGNNVVLKDIARLKKGIELKKYYSKDVQSINSLSIDIDNFDSDSYKKMYIDYIVKKYHVNPAAIREIKGNPFSIYVCLADGKIFGEYNHNLFGDDIKQKYLKQIYDSYELSKYGIKLADVVRCDYNQFGNICTLELKEANISFMISTKQIVKLSNEDNIYTFKNGHVSSSKKAPGIFSDNNSLNGQYGGNQMDFKYNSDILLSNPEILKVLQENFPNATMEDYELYLHKMCNCGCGYTACINSIFELYQGREEDFYNDFGIEMYNVSYDGNVDYNYEPLIVSFFTYIWHDYYNYSSIEDIYGNIGDINVTDAALSNEMSAGADGTGEVEYLAFSDFLKSKYNVNFDVSYTYVNENSFDINDYYKLLSNNIHSSIIIGSNGYDLYSINEDGTRGEIQYQDGDNHGMTIVGIENNEVIVSSWGEKYIIDTSNLTRDDDYLRYIVVSH